MNIGGQTISEILVLRSPAHKQITATGTLLTSKENCQQMTLQAMVSTSFGPTSIWPPANDHKQIWYLVKAQTLVPQANVGQANILSRLAQRQ